MYYRLITLSIMMLFFITPYSAVNAQQQPPVQQNVPDIDVSEGELEKFVSAFNKVKDIQENANDKMTTAIEKEGMDVQRFIEIDKIDRNPEKDLKNEIPKKEFESFKKAKQKVSDMQKNMRKDIQQKQKEAIQSEGISVEKFVKIQRAVRTNPDLQQRIKKEIQQSNN